MNCKHGLAVVLIVVLIVIFLGAFLMFQNQVAQSRRDLFLINQCANERTVSIVFGDGSQTHCLPVAQPEQAPTTDNELEA